MRWAEILRREQCLHGARALTVYQHTGTAVGPRKYHSARGGQKAGAAGEEGKRAMTLELFVMWAIVRLLAGWPTGFVVEDGGYGLMGDMALGLVGSLLGSWIFLAMGVSVGAALVMLVVVAFIGAVLVIGAQRMIWAHA